MLRRTLIAALVLTASGGHAWEVSVQVFSETTFRGSSETTSASTRADKAARRNRRHREAPGGASEGTQCSHDDECYGHCTAGRCVDPAPPAGAVVQPPPNPHLDCVDDQSCAPGYGCRDRRCVELAPQPPPPGPGCAMDEQCVPGQSCIGGQCVSPPPPPPPGASLLRQGSELYLRARAVQLRQDLALGEGPVVSTLASLHGVSALSLGRTMRAHRAELAALMGDGTDVSWAGRFLIKLEELSVSLSPAGERVGERADASPGRAPSEAEQEPLGVAVPLGGLEDGAGARASARR